MFKICRCEEILPNKKRCEATKKRSMGWVGMIKMSENSIQNIQVQGVLHPLCQCAWWTGGGTSEGREGGAQVVGSQVQGNQGQALLREALCKAALLLVKRINPKTYTAVQLKCSETTICRLIGTSWFTPFWANGNPKDDITPNTLELTAFYITMRSIHIYRNTFINPHHMWCG